MKKENGMVGLVGLDGRVMRQSETGIGERERDNERSR